MLLHRLYILLLLFAFQQASAQNYYPNKEDTPGYKFKTALKGGYTLTFKTDDSLQYLYLHNGHSLRLLSYEQKYNPQQLLGLVAADFKGYFVLAHTIHIISPQDPIMFELYQKRSAKKVLRGNYIDTKEVNNVILMHNNDSTGMFLYNVVTTATEHFPFPKINTDDSRLINRIRIKGISPNSLPTTYCPFIDADELEKTYQR